MKNLVLVAFALCACGPHVETVGGGERGGVAGGAGSSTMMAGPGGTSAIPDGPAFTFGCQGKCESFPSTPIFVEAGDDAALRFRSPSGAVAGPCIVEPENGAVVPWNWLRPRVRWIAAPGQNLFEITVTVPSEKNPMVIYTTRTTWTMPLELWKTVARNSQDQVLSFSVRAVQSAANGNAPSASSKSELTIAPVSASGSLVYWSTKSVKPPTSNQDNTSDAALNGFAVGDEGIVAVLTPPQVQMSTKNESNTSTPVRCVGCHTATPDGAHAVFMTQWPWGIGIASVEKGSVGAAPAYMTPAASSSLARHELGITSFSAAVWGPGKRRAISTLSKYREDTSVALVWLDLEASEDVLGKSYGVIARTGDSLAAIAPAFSPDGKSIVYTSTSAPLDGRVDKGTADLRVVPYNDGLGGVSTPLAGAATTEFSEYYPAISTDGSLVAYNRLPANMPMYNQPQSEVFVVPSAGGAAVRLAANDAPACSGAVSPGIKNSWPKWSPEVMTVGSRTYHFLVFSSTRANALNSQLYMAAVVREGSTIKTYPAVYLWNQPADVNNHTPAWNTFKIPAAE
jgi:hypothetical protein